MERNEEKIMKQRNSLLWNPHKIFLGLLAFAAFAGLFWACGATVWTAVAIYLGYQVLKLALRLIGLLFPVFLQLFQFLSCLYSYH